ncbi:MAG: DUF3426 domain-containing protein [Pseudomonadota bacterium]
MITQCPHCETRFEIEKSQLEIGGGFVRCGVCMETFDARQRLTQDNVKQKRQTITPASGTSWSAQMARDMASIDEQLAALSDIRTRGSFQKNKTDTPGANTNSINTVASPYSKNAIPSKSNESPQKFPPQKPQYRADNEIDETSDIANKLDADIADFFELATPTETIEMSVPQDLTSPSESRTPNRPSILADSNPIDLPPAPMFSTQGHTAVSDMKNVDQLAAYSEPPKRSRLLPVMIFIGMLLMIIGGVALSIKPLSQNETARVWMVKLCNTMACKIAPFHNLDYLKVTRVVIRESPDLENALRLDAIVYNRSQFGMEFPALEVHLIDGRLPAPLTQRLTPKMYRQGELLEYDDIPSETSIHISVNIADPGVQISNYELHLRYDL